MIRRPPRFPLFPTPTLFRSSDPTTLAFLDTPPGPALKEARALLQQLGALDGEGRITDVGHRLRDLPLPPRLADRKSTRLNSSHANISYAVFCLKKKTYTSSS